MVKTEASQSWLDLSFLFLTTFVVIVVIFVRCHCFKVLMRIHFEDIRAWNRSVVLSYCIFLNISGKFLENIIDHQHNKKKKKHSQNTSNLAFLFDNAMFPYDISRLVRALELSLLTKQIRCGWFLHKIYWGFSFKSHKRRSRFYEFLIFCC